MALDTLGYVKRLESAGIDRKVAEAHIDAMREHVLPDLATKQDITDLKLWIVGTAIAVSGLALAVAKFF